MIEYFLTQSAQDLRSEKKSIDRDALNHLTAFSWPGNIRQLENICRYLTVMCSSSTITIDDLPDDILGGNKVDDDDIRNWKLNLQRYVRESLPINENVLKDVNTEFEKILIDKGYCEMKYFYLDLVILCLLISMKSIVML